MSDVPQVFDRNGNALEPPEIDKYGNGVDRPNYEIYYSTTRNTRLHANPCSVSDETCMAIAPKDMSTIRTVVIRLPHTKYGYRVVWHMKATKAGHHLIDGVGELENEGFVDVQAPGLWTVKADTKDTSAEPYDTVRTTIAPQLADVPSSTLDMTADLNVCASNGLARPASAALAGPSPQPSKPDAGPPGPHIGQENLTRTVRGTVICPV